MPSGLLGFGIHWWLVAAHSIRQESFIFGIGCRSETPCTCFWVPWGGWAMIPRAQSHSVWRLLWFPHSRNGHWPGFPLPWGARQHTGWQQGYWCQREGKCWQCFCAQTPIQVSNPWSSLLELGSQRIRCTNTLGPAHSPVLRSSRARWWHRSLPRSYCSA